MVALVAGGDLGAVRRKLMDEICEQAVFEYEVISADIDERAIR